MIKISKEIAQTLNSNYGVPYGENGISHTVAKVERRHITFAKMLETCKNFRN